jgi:predicted P-loop ATPase
MIEEVTDERVRVKEGSQEGEYEAGHWWITSVILATQEAELRRVVVQSQPRQIVHEILSQKTHHKKRTGGVTQGVGPEFKPQYCKKKKNKPKTKKETNKKSPKQEGEYG